MPPKSPPGAPQFVKDVADAFSAQSKLSNRLWLTVMVVTVFIIVPDPTPKNGELVRSLPFGFGETRAAIFDVFASAMLSILTIAFCQAHAQTIRAYRFAHQTINSFDMDEVEMILSARRFFDLLSIPSPMRVSPLPQLIRESHPNWPSVFYLRYYSALKFAAILILFGAPLFALGRSYVNLFLSQSVWVFGLMASLLGTPAVLAVFQIAWEEWQQGRHNAPHLAVAD